MRLGHHAGQVQAQADPAGAALARIVGAVKGFGQARQLLWRHARAVVAHLDQHVAVVGHAKVEFGRRGAGRGVAQRVVEQVAQQQARAAGVEPKRCRQTGRHVHRHIGRGGAQGGHVADQRMRQRGQIGRLALKRGVAAGQALAFQQVGDQVAHLRQVAQQRGARGRGVGVLGQQFGVEPSSRQRRAQLVADGQQQVALGVQHLVDVGGHAVHAVRQVAQLVGMGALPHPDRRLELPGAKAAHALADVADRPQHAVHHAVGQRRQRQQRRQREPDEIFLVVVGAPGLQRELDPVAIGRLPADGVARPHGAGARPAFFFGARPGRPVARPGAGHPVDRRPRNAHRQRQAFGQRLRPRDAGRRAQLVHQAVGVVDEQRLGGAAPAGRQRLADTADERHAHRQRQQQKQQHQPHAQRMPQAAPGAGGGRFAHQRCRCRASV